MSMMAVTWRLEEPHEHCPICLALAGYMWTLPLGDYAFPTTLYKEGLAVYDLVANRSIAHESAHIVAPCYCRLEVMNVDFSDLVKRIRDLTSQVVSHHVLPSGEMRL